MPLEFGSSLASVVAGDLTPGRATPTDYTIVVPQIQLAVGATTTFSVVLSTAFDYAAAGMVGSWNHANWRIQLFDARGTAIQSDPAAGPLVVGQEQIIRPFVPMLGFRAGSTLRGTITNTDGANPLTLNLCFRGIALS